MKLRIAALTLAILLAVPATRAADDPNAQAIKDAVAAAEAWLALTDAGDFARSHDEAAAMFKSAVTKEQWQGALGQARTPLGKLKSRKVKSTTFSTSLPGAPAGEYVVIQFDASFEKKDGAVETVTPSKEKDGKWRVSGYYIK